MREAPPTSGQSAAEAVAQALSTAKVHFIFFLFLLATEQVRPAWRCAKCPEWTSVWLSISNSNCYASSRCCLLLCLNLVWILNYFIFYFYMWFCPRWLHISNGSLLIYVCNYFKNCVYFIKNLFNLGLIVKKACIFALKILLMQA